MKWTFVLLMGLSLAIGAMASESCSDNEAKNELERVLGVSYLFFY
jgi:hypothetical protein